MKDLSKYGILKEKGRSYESIIYVLALIYNLANQKAEEYFAQYNLSVAKFNVLMLAAFRNEGKGITQVDMAKSLIASASNITKLVDDLKRRGLISRTQNTLNRRENIIRTTDAGRKMIDKVWPEYDKMLKSFTDKIPVNKQKTAAAILNGWFENLTKEDK